MDITASRWTGAAGLSALGAIIAGNSLAGHSPPPVGAPATEVDRYLAGLETGAASWTGAALEVLGLLALLVFFAGLARRASASGLVLGAAAAAIAVKVASMAPVIALWLRPETADGVTAGLVLDTNAAAFTLMVAMLGLAVVAGAPALGGWLGRTGVVAGVAMIASLPLVAEGFIAGFLLFLLWLAAAGVALARPAFSRRPAHVPA